MSVKTWAEAHSVPRWGELMARIVVKESHSMIRRELQYLEASYTARRAALASPWLAPHVGKTVGARN